jgi:hypothetical protein
MLLRWSLQRSSELTAEAPVGSGAWRRSAALAAEHAALVEAPPYNPPTWKHDIISTG